MNQFKAKEVINVCELGAVGDGKSEDTIFIQKGIDAAAERKCVLYIPEGTYLIGTIYLKSDVTMLLDEQAVLLGSPDIAQYGENTHFNRYCNEPYMDKCLIYAEDCKNINLFGGTYNGNGEAFYQENVPDTEHPMLFRFLRAENIRMEKINIRMPAGWSTAFIECENIHIKEVDIVSRHFNGDGLDFDSCRSVFVSECRMDTSDDCLCIQNSVAGRTCEHIMVRNCIMSSRWAAVRIGLLNSGDIEDVIISECIFHDVVCSGFKIQATEAGAIRNLLIDNILMKNVARPLFITSNYYKMGVLPDGEKDSEKGIDGVFVSNIKIENKNRKADEKMDGIFLLGIPERKIKHVCLRDISYHLPGGNECERTGEMPELIGQRPEYYALGVSPAAVLYARHVEWLELRDFRYRMDGEDRREEMVFEDVSIM